MDFEAAQEKFAEAFAEFVRVLRLAHPELTTRRDEGRFVGGVLAGMLLGIWRRQSCGTDEDLLQFLTERMKERPRIKAVPPSEAP